MLSVRSVNAWYDKSHILNAVNFDIGNGEIVGLLGRNGVGRSTTIKAIMGEVERDGDILFKGQSINGLASHEIARRGLGYVPEDRQVFPTLTVRENLILGVLQHRKNPRWTMDDAFTLFPRLAERRDTLAGSLSGGEQQLLSMCRTLMGDPDLVLIDEPTEGLAPRIVEQVRDLLLEIVRRGASVLLVEQKLTVALRISDRVFVMGHGRIVFSGTPQEFLADHRVRREYIEV